MPLSLARTVNNPRLKSRVIDVCISALDEFLCLNYTTFRVLFPYRKGKGQTANELRDLVHLIPKKLEVRTLLGIELQKIRTKTASPPKIA